MSEHDVLQLMLTTKHTITSDNFAKAVAQVQARPAGDYLAEKLESALQSQVGQRLSVGEWNHCVQVAYREILASVDSMSARMMRMAHPEDTIILTMLWAIPS